MRRLGALSSPRGHSYEDPASQPLPSIKAERENYGMLKRVLLRKAFQDKEEALKKRTVQRM